MSNRMKAVILALVAATAGAWAGAVRAVHVEGACALELNAVEAAINAAVFQGQRANTDKSNLLAKLDAADAKVDLDKFSDAVDKLDDISDKASELANAAKAKLADATGINTAVSAAIACVGSL